VTTYLRLRSRYSCVPASPRPALVTPRRVVGALAAGTVAAAAVPVVQGALLRFTRRPDVPGPHDQDGLVGSAAPPAEPVRLVWLGDSLASGLGADTPDGALPRKAAGLFCATDNRSVDLTCLARPGACAADVLADQVPRAIALLGAGSVAVVTVGSNDVGNLTWPGRFRRDYDAILAALSSTGATIITTGLPDIGSAIVIRQPLRALARWVGRRADSHVQTITERHGGHFVGIDHRAEGAHPVTYLAADRYHPNADTYALWAGRVAALLTLVATAAPIATTS
jgi:lysophospholipase L1-like esterase